MIEAYKNYWKRFKDYKGVSTRKEYWAPWLFNLIIITIITIPTWFLEQGTVAYNIFNYISIAWSIVNLVPGIPVFVRRMRDAGYKWTNCFLVLIPLVGFIILIVQLCKPSKKAA